MESLYQELKTRFSEYPLDMISNYITIVINEPVKIFSFGWYYDCGCNTICDQRQIIDKIQDLIKRYQYLQNLLLELQSLLSFFDIPAKILGSYYPRISCDFFDTSYDVTYSQDKLKINIYYDLPVDEPVTLETENCYNDLKRLFTNEIKRRQNEYLCKEYLIYLDDNNNLSNLVGYIVNQQTEIIDRKS